MKLELATLILGVASSPTLASGRSSLQARLFGIVSVPSHGSHLTSCKNNILALRGGEVHESQTMDDLESRIQSAALNNKLTVIDFTATW